MKRRVPAIESNEASRHRPSVELRTRLACAGVGIVLARAVGLVIPWAPMGPLFECNDSWELVINTGTTIMTFLTVCY